MFSVKFIYDLFNRPIPKKDELDEEIERLLYLKTAEEPNFLEPHSEFKPSPLDAEVVTLWLRRKFEPALLLLLLGQDNYYISKAELAKMERYKEHQVETLFRDKFLDRHAKRRIKELCFDDLEQVDTSKATVELKKTLTFLAKHLAATQNTNQGTGQNSTLFGTKAYTRADVVLYNYLKRTLVGKHHDSGLKSHIKQCEALIEFMRSYAKLNVHILDITSWDPSADDSEESNLLADITKPAVFVAAIMMFYLWRHS